MRTGKLIMIPWIVLALVVPALAQADDRLDGLKRDAVTEVEGNAKLTQEMVDMIYSNSELGFQEFWTADYVTGILEREGFTVERGCAGMPTCYVGTWGTGSPVVGFMGDIDG